MHRVAFFILGMLAYCFAGETTDENNLEEDVTLGRILPSGYSSAHSLSQDFLRVKYAQCYSAYRDWVCHGIGTGFWKVYIEPNCAVASYPSYPNGYYVPPPSSTPPSYYAPPSSTRLPYYAPPSTTPPNYYAPPSTTPPPYYAPPTTSKYASSTYQPYSLPQTYPTPQQYQQQEYQPQPYNSQSYGQQSFQYKVQPYATSASQPYPSNQYPNPRPQAYGRPMSYAYRFKRQTRYGKPQYAQPMLEKLNITEDQVQECIESFVNNSCNNGRDGFFEQWFSDVGAVCKSSSSNNKPYSYYEPQGPYF